jgi:diguanylate cyclase (GGDEF)-like protein
MLDFEGDDVRRSSAAAKKSLWLLSFFSILFLITLAAERVFYQSETAKVAALTDTAKQSRAAILLADEKLTMSALAYAGTADERMRARYENSIPEIDAAIAQARSLVHPDVAARFDSETSVANDRLVALEALAFLKARRGQTAEARAVFDSDDYRANKVILAEGSEHMLAALNADVQKRADRLALIRRIMLSLLGFFGICAFTVLIRRVHYSLRRSESAFFSAMAEMEASEKAAMTSARSDAMVGLPNRLSLLEVLNGATKQGLPITLLYLDLDGFKSVNDTYGHETGDELLRAVSEVFRDIVGGDGFLSRLGGDEFAILLTGQSAADKAVTICKRIHTTFAEPFDIGGRIANVGASIGIASSHNQVIDPTELMRQADVAMYEAKANGRNLTREFDAELDQKRQNDFDVAASMRFLIASGNFEVAYQPIVDSGDGRILGVEALARWPSATGQDLKPDYFIRVAEEYGVIDDLGALILDIACRDLSAISSLRLAVNVSPLQLNNPNFVEMVVETAARSDFDLRRLDIELTENVLIRYPALQALGVTVSLDDFGTGFASVGYLREFGFDNVKLDQSLTQAILTDPAAQQVVQGTIMIANGLRATTVAEGVETVAESDVMRLLGCKQLQGFLYGRPAGLETFGIEVDQAFAESERSVRRT